MAEIETLTPAQWQRVAEIRAKYLAAGLCTDPVDRPAAEAAITRVYRLYGKPAPRFVWVASPGAVTDARSGGPWQDRGRILDGADERAEALPFFGNGRGDNLSDGLRHVLGSRLSVACAIWERYLDERWPTIEGPWYGFLSDLAFHDALRRLGIVSYEPDENERLDLWVTLAACGGPWSPYERVCFVCERPSAVHIEAAGPHGTMRPHNADGPAVMFRDGWRMYAWHGMRVPAGLIEDGWDLDRIFTERDAGIRRCAIERFGWDRLEGDLAVVAVAPDPGNPGQELKLCDLPERLQGIYGAQARILFCEVGTPGRDGMRHRVGLPVPARYDDPVAAAASLYEWSAGYYREQGEVGYIAPREAPVVTHPACHGDVWLETGSDLTSAITPIPEGGIAVMPKANGDDSHSLHGTGFYDYHHNATKHVFDWWIEEWYYQVDQMAGTLTVPDGADVSLVHPHDGALRIAPGTYRVGCRRDYTEEWRAAR